MTKYDNQTDAPSTDMPPANATSRYLIVEGWEHIFSDHEGPLRIRWVLNAKGTCVAAQYLIERTGNWASLDNGDLGDLEMSIVHTNHDLLEEIIGRAKATPDESEYISTTLPEWAR